jgi:S1-C subfamily serine protease
MTDHESPAFSWTCPQCSRRVPNRRAECHCGYARQRPAEASSPEASADIEARRPGTNWSLLATAVVAIAAVAAAFYWVNQRPAAPPTAGAGRPPVARGAINLPTTAVLNPVTQPVADAPNTVAPPALVDPPAPPASERTAEVDSLEDVVSRAMPAVVRVETEKSRGSGFLVRPDLVVTNAHVTAGSLTVSVTSQAGAKMTGRVSQSSGEYDIAVIQVGGFGATDVQLPLGSSANLRLGQSIVALGWAEGLKQSTLTRGVITGLRRVGDRQMVQTDAVPNPGDSGGPVLDRAGAVVGVTTFRFDNGSGGLAVPIDDVKPFVAKIAGAAMAPPRSAEPAVVPRPSESDMRRGIGVQRYESDLAAVADRAATLDAAWTRYRAICRITSVPAGQAREWFNLYDPSSPLHRAPERCANVLNDVQRQADAINAAVLAAQEAARRADVYPGTRRDLLRRYHLDYAGWDR